MSSIKERLFRKENLYGTWCILPSPEVINVIGKSGIDFVIIDQEHGAMDTSISQKMVVSAQAEGCSAIVRVGENDELRILQALDIGVDGIIVPHIETVEECVQAVSFAKYPPSGIRGFSPYARSGGYTNVKGYTNSENIRVLMGIIIEGEKGIRSIYDISCVKGLDLVYVGTYDISSVLGIPGEVTNKKVVDTLTDCVKEIKRAGKIPGCMFSSFEEMQLFDDLGINFRVYDVDSSIVYKGYSGVRKITGGNVK